MDNIEQHPEYIKVKSKKADYPIENFDQLMFLIGVAYKRKHSDWVDKKIFELEIIRRDVYYQGKLHKRQ